METLHVIHFLGNLLEIVKHKKNFSPTTGLEPAILRFEV